KRVTRRLLEQADLAVPAGRSATFDDQDQEFLDRHGPLVVKPARGEQGRGITVGVETERELTTAIERARSHCPDVLLETLVPGRDLRILVIDGEVVAAAERRPATIQGNGEASIRELV